MYDLCITDRSYVSDTQAVECIPPFREAYVDLQIIYAVPHGVVHGNTAALSWSLFVCIPKKQLFGSLRLSISEQLQVARRRHVLPPHHCQASLVVLIFLVTLHTCRVEVLAGNT